MRADAASRAKSLSAAWRDALRMVAISPPVNGLLRLGRCFDRRAGRVDVALKTEPLAPERAHVLDQGQQGNALGREDVLDARRDLWVCLARDDALLLERLQPERERARADPVQRSLQLTEPAPPRSQVADDQDRPLAADNLRGGAYGAGAGVLRGRSHRDSASKRTAKLQFLKCYLRGHPC